MFMHAPDTNGSMTWCHISHDATVPLFLLGSEVLMNDSYLTLNGSNTLKPLTTSFSTHELFREGVHIAHGEEDYNT